MYWRAFFDDGTSYKYMDMITVTDAHGTRQKPASTDDIDRDRLSQLVTYDAQNRVVHTVGIPKPERQGKKVVWRFSKKFPTAEVLCCLVGTVERMDANRLYFEMVQVFPDGTVTPAAVDEYDMDIHDCEIPN